MFHEGWDLSHDWSRCVLSLIRGDPVVEDDKEEANDKGPVHNMQAKESVCFSVNFFLQMIDCANDLIDCVRVDKSWQKLLPVKEGTREGLGREPCGRLCTRNKMTQWQWQQLCCRPRRGWCGRRSAELEWGRWVCWGCKYMGSTFVRYLTQLLQDKRPEHSDHCQ